MRKISILLMASFMAFSLLSLTATTPAMAGTPQCTPCKIVPIVNPSGARYPVQGLGNGGQCDAWWPFGWNCGTCCQACAGGCGMCIDLYGCNCQNFNPSFFCYGQPMADHCE